MAGAPEKLPEPPAAGVRLGFDFAYARPAGSIALVGGRIVTLRRAADGSAGEVIEDGVVVVERNRIVAVGPRAGTGAPVIPAGTKIIDVAGKTLIPGLVDAHWHGSQGSDRLIPEQNWVNLANLAYGVTTIHDPSNDTNEIFAAAELQKSGAIVAPRIFSTGTILYGAKGDFKAEIDSKDDALSNLRRMKAAGAFSVKSYNQPRREQRQQVIAAGRDARDDGGARGRLAPRPEPHPGGRRPHRRRAFAAGRGDLRRRHPALGRHRGRLHADARRRLRRPDGRGVLVRQDRRLGGEAARRPRAARSSSICAPAGGRPRRTANGTTSSRRRMRKRSPTPASRCSSAPTASAKVSPRTGSSGCWCRAG